MTSSTPNTGSSDTNVESRATSAYIRPRGTIHPELSFIWGLYKGTDSTPVSFGQVNYLALTRKISSLLKLERQHRERLAAVSLDLSAQMLLNVLDKETSIKWEDLPASAECDWSKAARAASLLAGANLCDVSPTRIRLSEFGDKMLAGSPTLEGIYSEIGPTPVQ